MQSDYQRAVEIVAAHLCDSTVEYFRLNGDSFRNFHKDKARSLLALTWRDGGKPLLAVLAKDQTWPDPKQLWSDPAYPNGHKDAQIEAMQYGFRRTVQPE